MLLAPRCLACDLPLDSPSDGPVCGPCWQSIRPLSPPLCTCCGEPLAGPRERCCPRCARTSSNPVVAARAAGEYAGALRQLIHALKYDGRQRLATPIAALMRGRGREVLDGASVVVPVPLHWRRRWQRGFNQAETLARELGLPVCRALVRARPTSAQFGLAADARETNVSGAFQAARWRGRAARRAIAGGVVVLVDDVATTGATLRACGEVLKAMGAREVRALTAARAMAQRR